METSVQQQDVLNIWTFNERDANMLLLLKTIFK